jgi:hypothetical protein
MQSPQSMQSTSSSQIQGAALPPSADGGSLVKPTLETVLTDVLAHKLKKSEAYVAEAIKNLGDEDVASLDLLRILFGNNENLQKFQASFVVDGRPMSLMAWTLIGNHLEDSNTPIPAVVPGAKRQKLVSPQVPLATALLAGAKKMTTSGKYFKNCTCINMVETVAKGLVVTLEARVSTRLPCPNLSLPVTAKRQCEKRRYYRSRIIRGLPPCPILLHIRK